MISGGYRCPLYDDDAAVTTTDLGSDQATRQLDSAIFAVHTPIIATDHPRIQDKVAHRELLPSVTHRRWKYLNNRAENSHQSTRVRERVMKRFAWPGQAQRLLFAFGSIRQHFRPRRHLISAPEWRTEMTNRFAVWTQIITAAAA